MIIEIFNSQKKMIQSGETLDYNFRLKSLIQLKKSIEQHEQLIYESLRADLNRPPYEVMASEVEPLYKEINCAIKNLKRWMKHEKVSTPLILWPSKSYKVNEPLGVTLIISPWNYPFLLTLKPLIGAIASGCTTIIKPSEISNRSSIVLEKMISSIFDKNYIFLKNGDDQIAKTLLSYKFDFVFFTGSTHVGREVLKLTSQHLIPTCLELGGKSPCIITKGSNLKYAAQKICFGKFFNSGQTCIAPDYIYIHESEYQSFCLEMAKELDNAFPLKDSIEGSVAKIINTKHFNRLKKMIDFDKVIYGKLDMLNDELCFIPPIVQGPTVWTDKVMQEEIFGPLLPVLTYNNLNDVVRVINSKDKPLALYIFSSNDKLIDKLTSLISFGTCCINDCLIQANLKNLPFGGVGASGMGKYSGAQTYKLFSNTKSILKSKYLISTFFSRRPYNSLKYKIMKKIISFL